MAKEIIAFFQLELQKHCNIYSMWLSNLHLMNPNKIPHFRYT